MTTMLKFLGRVRHDNRAATAVEYGLIVALIFLASAGAMQAFGTSATNMWFQIASDYLSI
jgi:pilus assembly protein Flp/PilA